MDGDHRDLPEEPGDDWSDEEDGGFRGWIPPDDRLWRHPSEARAQDPSGANPRPDPGRTAARSRSGPWMVGGAAACMVLVLVASGLIVITAGSSDQTDPTGTARVAALLGVPTTEAGVSRMPDAAAIAGIVSTARPSVVSLRVTMPTKAAAGTGIVVESGGIIVTASQLVSGARTVTVIETNGTQQSADVVGIDQHSGLAVLRIADDLPAARFDMADPAPNSVAVAVALRPASRSGTPPVTKVYAGTVASTGRAVDSDATAHLLSASVIQAPLAVDDIGCPLLDRAGQVSGLLEWTGPTGGATSAVFLPAEVVLGVAQQLVSSGAVEHGWLGVETADAGANDPLTVHTTTAVGGQPVDGARLTVVDQNSPAAASGLQVGDVIVGVDGNPVHSKSELDARLYADAPGTELDLHLLRGANLITLPVVLADAGSDAPGGDSSP